MKCLSLLFPLFFLLPPSIVAGTISGTIFHSDGVTPLVATSLPIDLYQGDQLVTTVYANGADGTYLFSDVAPGLYYVKIGPNYFSRPYVVEWYASPQSVRDKGAAQQVSSSSSNIDFQLDIGASVSGVIYHKDGVTPVTEGIVIVEVIQGDPCRDHWTAGWGGQDITTGRYSLTGLDVGTYYVKTATYSLYDSHENEWWASPLSTLSCADAQEITVQEGEAVTGKNIQLNPKGDLDADSPGVQQKTISPIINLILRELTPG